GTAGKAVRRLQEHLNLKHKRMGVDGDSGPASDKALHRFQHSPLAGAIDTPDEKARDNRTDDIHRALEPVSGPALEHAAVLLAIRYSRINPHELGQNQGPWVRLFMRGNEGPAWPWCLNGDTEILPQVGWVRFADLSPDHGRVAQ